MINEELILLAKQGNISAVEQLYFNNLPLIRKMCKRFFNNVNEQEDVLQEAYFCLLQAIEDFDTQRGYKFITYLTNMIRWQMPRLLKKTVLKEQLNLNCLTGSDKDTEIIDLLEDNNIKEPENGLILNEYKNITHQEVNKLPEDLSYMVFEHFGKKKSVNTLAAEMNIDSKYVARKLRLGKERLSRNHVLRKLHKEWVGDTYSRALKGTGLQIFRYTFTSSVERVVENNMEVERKKFKQLNVS